MIPPSGARTFCCAVDPARERRAPGIPPLTGLETYLSLYAFSFTPS